MNEKELIVDTYIGFKGTVANNLILIKQEKQLDEKTYYTELKKIEEEENLENEKKKKLRKVFNLKNIDVNSNYYELKREELKYNFFMIYVIGTNIIKEDIINNQRIIFKSDDNKINKIYVDKSKKYICCCKESKLSSSIYIFDMENKKPPIVLSLHRFKTQDVSISTDAKYLLSSGGDDDKQLILTQIVNQKFIYKSISDCCYTNVSFFHKSNNFIIAKMNSIKICYYDFSKKRMSEQEVNTSVYKRKFVCLELKENDEYAYLGTTTGDIFVINMKSKVLERIIPDKYLFGNGINVIKILDENTILAGSGDGFVSLIDIESKTILKKKQFYGSINSIQMRGKSTLFVSVFENIIYVFDMVTNSHHVLLLIHNNYINDICFPCNYNYVMFTCSYNCIMAWQFYDKKAIYLKNVDKGKFVYYDKKILNLTSEKTKKKMCKIHQKQIEDQDVINKEANKNKTDANQKMEHINKKLNCYSIQITQDGKYIACAIHGNVYILTPKYMKTIFVILNCHYEYCSILMFYKNYNLITAGNHGDIKLWKFNDKKYVLINTINYHSTMIKNIILYNDIYLCSCSVDGLIIMYNIAENVLEKKIIDTNNIRYRQICLNKKYEILLCAGNNNIFMYYDLVKKEISKHFHYSPFYCVHSMDIHKSGNYFITGSDDFKLRLYDFMNSSCLFIGNGHSNIINKCVFTFDNQYIISTSKDEAMIYWKVPPEIKESDKEN